MGLTILARLMGFFRDTLIALRFGASPATDAYIVAFTLPNFLVAVLSGALNSVLVPKVASLVSAGQTKKAWDIIFSSFLWLTAVATLLILLLWVFSDRVVALLAPGFPPAEAALAASLARILLGFVFFSVSAYLAGAVLNAHHRFAFAALGPAVMSGAAVIALLVLPHPPITLLADALLVGSMLQFVLEVSPLLPSIMQNKGRPHPLEGEVLRMGKLSVPVLVSSSVGSGNTIVDRIFGSSLAAGSITSLAFADRVIQVPFGVFGAAVSTALFPRFAETLAASDKESFTRLVMAGLRLVVLVTFPVTAAVLALAPPIIDVLFRHGAFTSQAAALTALCLRAYAFALIPYSLNIVLTRAYFAFEATLYIGMASVGMLVLNAVADALLVRVMGAPGLALATVVVEGTYATILISGLLRRLPDFRFGKFAKETVPVAAMAALAGLGAFLASGLIVPVGFRQAALSLLLGVAVLLIVSGSLGYVLKIPEVRRIARGRLRDVG